MAIQVLIIDDSALVREMLSDMISQMQGVEVAGTARDPYMAVKKIKALHPDVLTLDVEMPKMNGLEFLRRLMASHPLPVVMFSSWTRENSEAAIRALELGAVDVVAKPQRGLRRKLDSLSGELEEKIRAAASASMPAVRRGSRRRPQPGRDDGVKPDREKAASVEEISTTAKVIAIGASTGGTNAIRRIVTGCKPDVSGMLIVQHMPEKFTASFAESLNRQAVVQVKEAEDGDRILAGHAYIAPGNRHTLLKKSGAYYYIELDDGPRVNQHRPSVDKTFLSVAEAAGGNAVGMILTGMGDDGARGLKAMHERGAHTLAQDEETSVIFGMPREAIAAGGVDEVLSLAEIADRVREL